MNYSAKFAASFWRRVDNSRGFDSCWIWTGHVDRHGYGRFKTTKMTPQYTHVSAWVLTGNPLPKKNQLIRLECSTGWLCCNPLHMRLWAFDAKGRELIRGGEIKQAPLPVVPYRKRSGDRVLSANKPKREPRAARVQVQGVLAPTESRQQANNEGTSSKDARKPQDVVVPAPEKRVKRGPPITLTPSTKRPATTWIGADKFTVTVLPPSAVSPEFDTPASRFVTHKNGLPHHIPWS